MAKRTTTTRKKKKATGQKISYELIGVLFLFSAALGIGNSGFAGIVLANFFRFFVGETYPVKVWRSFRCLWSVPDFERERTKNKKELADQWHPALFSSAALSPFTGFYDSRCGGRVGRVPYACIGFLTDVRQADTASEMGGGLIGAAFYSGTYFGFTMGHLHHYRPACIFLVWRSFSALRRMMSWKLCAKLL